MASIDLPILSVKLNGVEKIREFNNNDLWMSGTDIVRIQFDSTKRIKSDNDLIGIVMGFNSSSGTSPYPSPDIYSYVNGARIKIRVASKWASSLAFIYSKSIVDNIVEFSGSACNFTFAEFTSYDGYENYYGIAPTISISSKKIKDNPIITVKSTSKRYGYLKAQLWQDGTLLAEQSKTATSSTAYTYTFTDINFVSANDLTVKMLNKKEPEALSEHDDLYSILTNESIITGLEPIYPIISDFLVIGTSIDNNITCSWTQADGESWIVQAIQNGVVQYNKSGTTATSCTFSVGEIKKGGKTTFKVIAKNAAYATSIEVTNVVNLVEPVASVSNFIVAGTRIDQSVTCSWKLSKVYNWKVQAMQGGSVLAEKTGTTETSCVFNAGELKKGGDITFRITVSNTWNNTYYDVVKNLIVPTSTVKDFIVNGTSIDNTITCKWSQTDVYNWTVYAIQNGVIKATKTGTSITGCTFNVGELVLGGSTVFRIIATNTWNSAQIDSIVALTYTQAKINLLDLPSTNVNTDNNFLVSWVTQNQTSFKLEVDGKIYSGITERSLLIPKNTVGKGIKTIKLTIWFKNSYYQNTDTKELTFTSYGKPTTPILNIGASINVATPTITWECDIQTAYRLVIKQDDSIFLDTLDTVSIIKSYGLLKALSNNTKYTVTLKIKSEFGLWSDEATVSILAEFDVPNQPTIIATNGENGSILLHVKTSVIGDTQYKYTEIWKKEPTKEWKRMAINLGFDDGWVDFYCGGGIVYQYKAVNIGHTGARIESNVVSAKTVVKDYNLYNIEDTNERFTFYNDVVIKPTLVRNVVSNKFSGCRAPKSERDNTSYYKCSIQFSSCTDNDEERLINLINNSKLLLLKDKKGHKWIGTITSDITPVEDDLGIKYFSFKFVEEAFMEQDVYNGGFNGITKYPLVWDGEWFFDGSEVFGQ